MPRGGLFRVETLGRLRTRGRLSSAFAPDLGTDEAGGTGQNMLVQRWLRAGEYRVSVTPRESAGHGAILASPAPLVEGAELVEGGRVHLALPAGTGAAFPLVVARPGRYRLELRARGPQPLARLDDADGWPVTSAGPMRTTELSLQPGRYRLLVSPRAVATVVAARLAAIAPPSPVLGHGPHPLPPEAPQAATWHEPAGSDPRLPDAWTFTLRGPADATLSLSAAMTGTLHRPDGTATRIDGRWTGDLPAGEYRLDASSLGRNDRLDYTVALSTAELQPGTPRPVTLPATVPFSLATAGVVDLSSWGGPVKAVLRDAGGAELLRSAGRPDDWNLAFSRRLPAGRYRLDLSAAVPTADAATVPQDPGLAQGAADRTTPTTDTPADAGSDASADASGAGGDDGGTAAAAGATDGADAGGEDAGGDASGTSDGAATAADDAQAPQSRLDDAPPGGSEDASTGGGDATGTVELRLDLPPGLAPVAAPATAAALPGTGVHVLTLPQPPAGALLVAQAASAGTAVLSLERREGGDWRTVSLAAGTAPLVAALGDDGAAPWRLEAWSADGGAAPVRLAARVLDDAGPALSALEGLPRPLAAARLRLPTPALLGLTGVPGAVLAASWPGHAATPAVAGRVAPQGDLLWLLAPAPGPVTATPLAPEPGTPLGLTVPAGGVVHLAAAPAAAGHARFWRAESGMGQPGLVGAPSGGGAVSEGGALASAAGEVLLRDAGGGGALPVEAVLLDLPLLPPAVRDPAGGIELPAAGAVPVSVPGGPMRLVLPPGVAVLGADGTAAWADRAPLARDLDVPAGVLTVVNTLDRPQAATLAGLVGGAAATLRPGGTLRRFLGAAGSFELPVEDAAGATLSVAGDATLQWLGDDGAVRRGRDVRPTAGRGRLVVGHAPGAVVVSMAAPGASPWPAAAAGAGAGGRPRRAGRAGHGLAAGARGARAAGRVHHRAGAAGDRRRPARAVRRRRRAAPRPARRGDGAAGRLARRRAAVRDADAGHHAPARPVRGAGAGGGGGARRGRGVHRHAAAPGHDRHRRAGGAGPAGRAAAAGGRLRAGPGRGAAAGAARRHRAAGGARARGRRAHHPAPRRARPVRAGAGTAAGGRAALPRARRAEGTDPMRRLRSLLLAGAAALLPAVPHAQPAAAPGATADAPAPGFDTLRRADGARVVPDHFLRRWDPVTLLLDHDAGPAGGGPEDDPDRLARLDPPHPGAWTWLGARTLQFRPAEPWEPLRTETVTTADGHATVLEPLLPLPVSTAPADGSNGTAGLDTVVLTFPDPVDRDALAHLLTIELKPQPGTPDTGTQVLGDGDFDVRPLERPGRRSRQSYLVTLHRAVPDGRIATLRLRLSDRPGLDEPLFSLALHSATPFKVTDQHCGEGFNHQGTDGVTVCQPDPSATPGPRRLVLQFSSAPAVPDIVAARDALRVTPPVDGLTVAAGGENELTLAGSFAADTPYTLSVAPGALHDAAGRPLDAPVSVPFLFAAGTPRIAWDAAEGVVERLGPQMLPLHGHGYDRADLRIHAIDPLGRDFWPFPRAGLVTLDATPPPLPGREPEHHDEPGPISGDDMAARIAALGSPAVSELVDLPIRRGGVEAKFGIDLRPALASISGPGQPGTYLVGLRATDGSARQWMRVQVTDLVLTTVEEAGRTRFVVTSLGTAQPVPGAEVRLEGLHDTDWATLAHGVTGADGSWTAAAPLAPGGDGPTVLRRIVVTKATDTLVLEPGRGPQQYAAGGWSRPGAPWLGWMTGDAAARRERTRLLCRVFTERPIYRPEEPVLIAGAIRRSRAGALSFASGNGEVVVTGPDQQQWHLPAPLDEVGGFHVRFDAKTEATGEYGIQYVPKDGPGGDPGGGDGCGAITVRKEAYRLPTFEVLLTPPARATLDRPFAVDLLARFYAGGLLDERPLAWRVTQTPFAWSPPGRDGFLFSSDARFSGDAQFRSTPTLSRTGRTDAGGSAQITLDPAIEPTAQPRQYLVEATVTGDDDQQVRATQRVTVLPPFVLGVAVPRYLPDARSIDPQVLALDGEGRPVTGLPMTVRLVHRQWNAMLTASDFAQGAAHYDTEVIDETVAERQVTSAAEASTLHFAVAEAGVYLVEVEAADRLGRRQRVRVDLFAAGGTPVTWSHPPARTVAVSTDKDSYVPGEVATLIVQSPFQSGRALAVVEQPEGRFTYDWVPITDGYARYPVPVRKEQAPRLPVHFLLMRGRVGAPPGPAAPFDQGRPETLAATASIRVRPVENEVRVSFDAPATARPGGVFDLGLHLADAGGRPLSGEATVWMVDQAVLALAREQPLDPLPAFIVDRPSRMTARDTRGLSFGILPLQENPGGDENGSGGMENISVRKNFTPVPLYVPRVQVGADGAAHVHVTLPDSLTVFMLRAEAISGPDRFGYGTGQLRVRQPVIAQLVLPRFVRPGDSVHAGLVGRVVEGPGGAGEAVVTAEHLTVEGGGRTALSWTGNAPARTEAVLDVPQPAPGVTGVRVRGAVRRLSDGVGDAVQVDLPIRPDRPVVHERSLLQTASDGLALPATGGDPRPGSYRRGVTLATDPDLVRLLAGLGALERFPVGGVEQRMSLAEGELALLPFTPLMEASGLRDRLAGDVTAAAALVRQDTDDDGMVAFWPHTPGNVWLTARAFRMLVSAGRAGLAVDKAGLDRLGKVLTASLRSDYPHLVSATALFERVAALTALADGGRISADDARELAQQAAGMPTASVAEIATVLARLPRPDPGRLAGVMAVLWSRIGILSRDGRPVYGGLTDLPSTTSVLPSEARSLALAVRAVATATPDDPRRAVLVAALTGMAGGEGWGSTTATAAALEALAAAWQPPPAPVTARIVLPDRTVAGTLDRAHPILLSATEAPGPVQVSAPAGLAVLASADLVPSQPGWRATATQAGLVLTRTLYRVLPDAPLQRIDPQPDGSIALRVGDVVEEEDELTSPLPRAHVALHLPLAAGTEPLNPALATATAEATPSAGPTVPPSWSSYGDDEVLAVWLSLPGGTATLRTRLRATVPGTYTLPPASAELLYQPSVTGSTAGQRVVVGR